MDTWIMPCNLKHFDIISWFKENDTVVWKATRGIKTGDRLYIYVGAPYSCILFQCVVLNDSVDEDTIALNEYARIGKNKSKWKYMCLKLLHPYTEGIPLTKLRDLGVYTVQRQVRINEKALDYILKYNVQLGVKS